MSMSEKQLRVGFIGGGWVTCNRHIPAAKQHPELELVGLISTERTLAELDQAQLKTKFSLQHFGSSLTESWVESLDAVIIGTPPTTHYGLVMQALSLGKHVLVEKPFAMTTAQAAEMVQMARQNQKMLAVCHNFQFSRASTRARYLLDTGKLGDLRGVFGFQCSNHERRLPRWYKELPLGLFTDESPHLFYLLRSFLGQMEQTSTFVAPSLASNDNTPHVVSTHFLAPNQITGSLYMTFVSALSEWQLMVFGSNRTAVIDIFRDVLVTLPNDKRHESMDVLRTTIRGVGAHLFGVATAGPLHLLGKLDYGNNEVVRRFVSAIRTGIPPQGMDAADGLAVVEIMERVTLRYV
jgi:scyllo-inositol 2-dehydrogenase (NADP+)